jgi:excisionase family DNA binding protein
MPTADTITDPDQLLRLDRAAQRLDCSRAFLYKAAARGDLTLVKMGRSTRIRAAELERFIAQLPALEIAPGQ